ncbi:hypothetical protein Asp14428_67760 [Actinoplanes sp. NBRC 14428]|nr:hypothetical protein Asp14428_67760 [Actinoplanes sp. NBRC 14428]
MVGRGGTDAEEGGPIAHGSGPVRLVQSIHVTSIDTDLARVLRENAARTERQGRPATESLDAARAAGAFALRTPASAGGDGASAVTVAGVLAGIGRHCPATAWIAGTCATSKTFVTDVFGAAAPPATSPIRRGSPAAPVRRPRPGCASPAGCG